MQPQVSTISIELLRQEFINDDTGSPYTPTMLKNWIKDIFNVREAREIVDRGTIASEVADVLRLYFDQVVKSKNPPRIDDFVYAYSDQIEQAKIAAQAPSPRATRHVQMNPDSEDVRHTVGQRAERAQTQAFGALNQIPQAIKGEIEQIGVMRQEGIIKPAAHAIYQLTRPDLMLADILQEVSSLHQSHSAKSSIPSLAEIVGDSWGCDTPGYLLPAGMPQIA